MKCSVCKNDIELKNDFCPFCKTEHALDYGAFPTFAKVNAFKKTAAPIPVSVHGTRAHDNTKTVIIAVASVLAIAIVGIGLMVVLNMFGSSKNKPTTTKSAEKTPKKTVEEVVEETTTSTTKATEESTLVATEPTSAPSSATSVKLENVMTHQEYIEAPLDGEIIVTGYVQATQSWWDNTISVYLQDDDGGYFCYNLACTEEDSKLLIPGAEIKVKGIKSVWGGEVEIVDATFEYLGQTDKIYEAQDVTSIIGTEQIMDYQNMLVSFDDMTVVDVSFKNELPGDDIYVTLSKDGVDYSFCLEYYLNGDDENFYNKVSSLQPGSKVRVEAFLYWYEGINPHITAVEVK